jgi:hypothetical protein
MRTRFTFTATVLLLVLCTLGFAQPAVAAAFPLRDSGCWDPYELEGTVYQACYELHGSGQSLESGTGSKYIYNLVATYTFYENGVLVQTEMESYHTVIVVQANEEKVYLLSDSRRFTYPDGTTCTTTYHVVVTNGETRLETSSPVCTL